MNKYINFNNFSRGLKNFYSQEPFSYAVVDNFFKKATARKLEKEFPKYNDRKLHEYKNYCEIKKTCNNWNLFPPLTYKLFTILNSKKITKFISKKLNISKVVSDYGLNGGGWHLMNQNGKLNPHLDYSMHPKIEAQRKFNLIIFLSSGWKKKWGGETCFYSHNPKNKKHPGELCKKIYPKFNRAVFFDVSHYSWHGVASIKAKKIRKSLAAYYLSVPKKNSIIKRQKTLYAPTKSQIGNKKILKFIELRSNSKLFSKVYKIKQKK